MQTADQLLTAALARAAELRCLPESTYRLQFHKDFTFRHAIAIVPYLAQLGITHVYCSPYLKARPGSTHGYDVLDHCSLNPELGTQADYDAFLAAIKQHNLSHILDTVPNHVGVATNDNKWWNDVLQHGRSSQYAHYFDIDWDSPHPHLKNKVLLPLLGTPRAEAISSGDLRLSHEDGYPYLRYHDRRFPIDPQSRHLLDRPLEELHAAQHYVLDDWRNAGTHVNYRRFFDINDLAALAQEHEDVFEATHHFTLSLCATGHLTGLRIDHPDGLYDPAQYLHRLQSHYLLTLAQSLYTGSDWLSMRTQLLSQLGTGNWELETPLYVTVEKILAPDEPLPESWPVAGTSGYDPLIQINSLFIDPAGEAPLTQLYQDFTGDTTTFEDLGYQKKKLILQTSLASELYTLTHRLARTLYAIPFDPLRHALTELIASFPIYRTYITTAGPSPSDRATLDTATNEAVRRNSTTDRALFTQLRDALLTHPDLAAKFQQLTAPATAKGIEDTAFYCHHRLISLSEVGGDPSRFGESPDHLHAYLAHRTQHHPHALTPLSTHDTKRSEDIRARLNVLSELPDQWRAHAIHWRDINARHKPDAIPAPDEEYLLYQTLLGAWPASQARDAGVSPAPEEFIKRIQAYIQKAMREAKLHTTWTAPNQQHESAVSDFIAAILSSQPFLSSFLPFQRRIAHFGFLNSLSQTTLRLAAPGVPDTYQGTELLDLSLVDPDNRRPVDYARRSQLLSSHSSILHPPSSLSPDELKLLITTRLLHTRRQHPGLFTTGAYTPLRPTGRHADSLFCFSRRHASTTAIVITSRLVTRLGPTPTGQVWANTHLPLPDGAYHEVITNRPFPPGADLPTILSDLPIAVLLKTS